MVRDPEIEVVIVEAGKMVVKESVINEARKISRGLEKRMDLLTTYRGRGSGFE